MIELRRHEYDPRLPVAELQRIYEHNVRVLDNWHMIRIAMVLFVAFLPFLISLLAVVLCHGR